MKLSLIDKSNYFKGLLLLVRKDKKISPEEKSLIKRVGNILGFEQKFCDQALRELLVNDYIIDEPPLFSEKQIAASFIEDGLKLAISDKDLHKDEIEWLKLTAEKNGLIKVWFSDMISSLQNNAEEPGEVLNLKVENFLSSDSTSQL